MGMLNFELNLYSQGKEKRTFLTLLFKLLEILYPSWHTTLMTLIN